MKGLLEMDFEAAICESLAAAPLYVQRRSEDFSIPLLCDLALLANYLRATQPTAWKKLETMYPGEEAQAVAAEIMKLRPKRGLLELLRNGFSLGGVGKIELATFKPATSLNATHRADYEANRFAIIRQFHFSAERPNEAIDLVILLNGLPLLSMEVKNEFTGQTWQQAQTQYRQDRPAADPFLKACLVHFALDTQRVSMTTGLANGKTRFLPFNRDLQNPPIPGNYAASYLWEEVLSADSLLDLVQNYLHWEDQKDAAGKVKGKRLIFPRYHQLRAVRRLLADARIQGSGHNYLTQHSAGSGKSNTIAWLAHQLASLFDDQDRLIFDSVIVITDRQVLDRQLQETIKQFERIAGVVKKIDKNTRQLMAALEHGERIIVCTLQKFSWLQSVLGGPASLAGKRFALIVDEAHSSQTGEAAKDLKLALTTPAALEAIIREDDEGYDPAADPVADELSKIMKARQRLPHISFFAFTATPKPKTLEVFGRDLQPFDHYSMRQAIAEGFILGVLQHYTTYASYFELLENAAAPEGYLVEKDKARRLLLRKVGRHPDSIEKKARIMLDHFFAKTVGRIGGQAKAMIVTSSRAHAVLYKQTVDRLLRQEYGGKVQALVAFSGKVTIAEEAFTEEGMNPPDAKDIREAFKTQKYRILIVANKFQTGFDQPLLQSMYVDKRLGGVATVQTLSRLNRIFPLKQDPLVLDFVNTQAEVEEAFQPFYGRTTLDRPTDPQKLYNMRFEIEQLSVFSPAQVDEFADLSIRRKATSKQLSPLFAEIVQGRFAALADDDQDRFRELVQRYVNQYGFLSQIITWIDPELEKLYLFAKLLHKYLPPNRRALPEEILAMVDMEHFRVQEAANGNIILKPEEAPLANRQADGHRPSQPPTLERLATVVNELNARFHFDFEERDKVLRLVLPKLAQDQGLVGAYTADNLETLRRQRFSESLEKALLASAGDFLDVLNRMSDQPDFKRLFESFMLGEFRKTLDAGDDPDSEVCARPDRLR